MKYAVGLAYVDGPSQLGQAIQDRLDEEGYATELSYIPIGSELRAYYQFDHGSMFGLDAGPWVVFKAEFSGGKYDGSYNHMDIPVGLTYGYMWAPSSWFSPYLRTGLKMHIGRGDFRDDTTVGALAAAGISLFNDKFMHAQLEIAYDTTQATYDIFGEDKDIAVNGLFASVNLVF
jgi:hypothetical protein